MKELLETGLTIAGGSLAVLAVASFWIPKALGWREKLAGLTPLMREPPFRESHLLHKACGKNENIRGLRCPPGSPPVSR